MSREIFESNLDSQRAENKSREFLWDGNFYRRNRPKQITKDLDVNETVIWMEYHIKNKMTRQITKRSMKMISKWKLVVRYQQFRHRQLERKKTRIQNTKTHYYISHSDENKKIKQKMLVFRTFSYFNSCCCYSCFNSLKIFPNSFAIHFKMISMKKSKVNLFCSV